MDVDVFDTDYKMTARGRGKLYEVDHDSLSQADIERVMQKDVDHIKGVLDVDVSNYPPHRTLRIVHHTA